MSERALELIRQLKHLPGKHPQKSHAGGRGGKLQLATPGVSIETEYGRDRYAFKLSTPGGAELLGYMANQDFENESVDPKRGELFWVEVPEAQRGQGVGVSMAKDALRVMANAGAERVNLSPISYEGKKMNAALERDGVIRYIRQASTGKEEYHINRAELE